MHQTDNELYARYWKRAEDHLGEHATDRDLADYTDRLIIAAKSRRGGILLLTTICSFWLAGFLPGLLPVPDNIQNSLSIVLGLTYSVCATLAACSAAGSLHTPISPHDAQKLRVRDAIEKGGAVITYADADNGPHDPPAAPAEKRRSLWTRSVIVSTVGQRNTCAFISSVLFFCAVF